jgi:hypothetical protein
MLLMSLLVLMLVPHVVNVLLVYCIVSVLMVCHITKDVFGLSHCWWCY